MTTSERERIVAFTHHFTRAQATDLIELPWGFVHLQRNFVHSHAHNSVVVTSAVSASELIATADELMGKAGLDYRSVNVTDDETAETLQVELVAAGYEHTALITMIDRSTSSSAPEHPVHAVSRELMRPTAIRDWTGELPHASAEVIAQLADRMSLYPLGADITHLAVFEGEEMAVRGELFIDAPRDIAQLESLYAHAGMRGRGYARSLVLEAQRRVRSAGLGLSFLVADLDDWPRKWYARLGYEESHRVHEFSRSIEQDSGGMPQPQVLG